MGETYLSILHNEVAILDKSENQVLIFDTFGGYRREGIIADLNKLIPVSAISILSTGLSSSEIFLNGKTKEVQVSYLSASRAIMKAKRIWQGTPFRVKHEENVPHVVLVSNLDTITEADVDMALQSVNIPWTICN